MRTIEWNELTWLNEPASVAVDGTELVVITGRETDFWQRTAYGFIHDDGHFLGMPLASEAAVEVTFQAAFEAQYDQAGLMLRAGPRTWLKTGVEFVDGRPFASVVVTNEMSDWSVAPLSQHATDAALTFRASRSGDGVTIRYRIGDDPEWQLLRLAYLPAEAELLAGPMCCSPSREGLSVRFWPVRVGPPDATLHEA